MHKIITSLYYPSVVVYTPYPLHIQVLGTRMPPPGCSRIRPMDRLRGRRESPTAPLAGTGLGVKGVRIVRIAARARFDRRPALQRCGGLSLGPA
eukprot:COSAG01_NODE_48403_length_381_cov_1.900709_1_plen_93_part_01